MYTRSHPCDIPWKDVSTDLQTYAHRQNELMVEAGCLLWGIRMLFIVNCQQCIHCYCAGVSEKHYNTWGASSPPFLCYVETRKLVENVEITVATLTMELYMQSHIGTNHDQQVASQAFGQQLYSMEEGSLRWPNASMVRVIAATPQTSCYC